MTRIALVALLVPIACGGSAADGGTDDTTGTGSASTGGPGGTETGTSAATSSESATTDASTSGGSGTAGTAGTTGGVDPWEDPVPDELLGCAEGPTGAIFEVGPTDDYRAMIQSMSPGDGMRFSPGSYTEGLPIHDLVGAPGACFYFESADPQNPARFVGSSSRNTVSLRDSRYVVVRNLELDGDGKLGDAVKAEGNATFVDHVVLEGLYIHGHDADQQVVGISTKCPAWAFWIVGNRIEGAGTGMYLGNSDGSAPFLASLVEHNVIANTLGYNLQIKHQNPLPSVPGLPTETTETIIRHNVLSKAQGANGGNLARPNLLLGHVPLSGPGTENRYLVYGNFFYANPVEALLQAEGNVAVYANVFVNDEGSAVRIQPHNDVPKQIAIFGNTVLAAETGIRVTGGDPNSSQRVFGNLVFAATPVDAPDAFDNLTGTRADAATYLAAPDLPPGAGFDPHPTEGASLPSFDPAAAGMAMAADRDFDGRLRVAGLVGAYDGPAEPGAWLPAIEPKP
ncbi:MAG: hypothetical protein D6705_13820 [Deltaproteobacteria bacterium]|nr:MAG: hypothetical protein D6705_13820 [Deltaproteobacteria bacterium]